MDRYYLGLDVGATNVRIAFFNETKNIWGDLENAPFSKFATAEEEVDFNIVQLITNYLQQNDLKPDNLLGVGLSLAANFDRNNGDIFFWPNNKLWNGFALQKYLSGKLRCEIVMEDDANAAALGEYTKLNKRGLKNLAYITVSTGIGCGLILNGELYVGSHGWAGELGHVKVINPGPLCRCGKHGCIQALASGPALLEKSRKMALQHGFKQPDEMEIVAHYAEQGISWAIDVFEEAGRHLAQVAAFLIMVLDLPLIILGGGVIKSGNTLVNSLELALNDEMLIHGRTVEISKSTLGDANGVIGALTLIKDFVNSKSS